MKAGGKESGSADRHFPATAHVCTLLLTGVQRCRVARETQIWGSLMIRSRHWCVVVWCVVVWCVGFSEEGLSRRVSCVGCSVYG